ncbi:MAG: Rieske 2Fe-2S domain-containing protein [Deltaproteobacteria bacterium]|nr:aromatic ring-hydroxylating dioxygenase subunit alpha [Candidatus Binatia bacterium]
MNALWHYWYPISWSREVTDKPVAVKLLDQPLVLWRASGQVSAFYDLCIHRGAALSLGWIEGNQLVCGYHGWNYAGDGSCTRIPSLSPDREIPAKARAKAFRARERYGLVWVCLGEPRLDIPEFPSEFGDPSFNWEPYTSEGQWRANAARMIENLADFSHFPWVHAGILGDPNQAESPQITLTEVQGGFQYEIDTPVNRFRASSAAKQLYTVMLPFMVIIQRRQPGSIERHTNIYLCTPVSNHETKFYRLAGRNYRDVKPDEQLNAQHRRIFEQDKRIVESQRPEELPLDLAEELHLRGPDTPALEYRRRLKQMGVEWQ